MADSKISLKQRQVIDLSHPLTPDMPVWPGDPAFEISDWATYEKDRYRLNRLSLGEHTGTHWGTPNTFIKDGRSAGRFRADELVIPAAIIDIQPLSSRDSDYRLSIEDVIKWEKKNGRVPPGSMVVLFTGWQNLWKRPDVFLGTDNQKKGHWPGFGTDTAAFLIQSRDIRALGTDTHGVDPGSDEGFSVSRMIYDADGMILECLTNLDQLPPTGSTLVIGGLPVVGGSGSPARVFAFLPPEKYRKSSDSPPA